MKTFEPNKDKLLKTKSYNMKVVTMTPIGKVCWLGEWEDKRTRFGGGENKYVLHFYHMQGLY